MAVDQEIDSHFNNKYSDNSTLNPLARISYTALGKSNHLLHHLGREGSLGKVYKSCHRLLLTHLAKQSAQLCYSECEKCGLEQNGGTMKKFPYGSIFRELGSTGIKIRPLGFGAGQLSIGEYTDEPEALAIISEAMNVYDIIDTADSYSIGSADMGHNETLIAKVLKNHPRKHKVIIASKAGLIRQDLFHVDFNISPQHLRESVEASLKRLDLPSFTLFYLHAPDLSPNANPKSFKIAIQTLSELRNEGKIQHIGISNVTLEQIKTAQKIAPITAVQNHLSYFDREDLKNGIVEYCQKNGISYIAYSPLGGRFGHKRISEDKKLLQYAKKRKINNPYQAALFWLLEQSPNIIPIPAARKMDHLLSSADVLKILTN